MTEKQGYENILRELRKAKAPSLHLDDYNYWFNKGIQEYVNERYNHYAKTQQLSDDMQALIKSTVLQLSYLITFPTVTYTAQYTGDYTDPSVPVTTGKRYGSDYIRFSSPADYWHFLGSHVTSKTLRPIKCHPAGFEINTVSKRLTEDVANGIINNAYLRPGHERPYHSFTDGTGGNARPDFLYFIGSLQKFGISEITIDYLKEPRKINLTIQQRDLPIDTSVVLEFPEYVCNEIIKRVVKLILEASSDPRLGTNPQVNNSIQ